MYLRREGEKVLEKYKINWIEKLKNIKLNTLAV